MSANPSPRISPEEYLAIDRAAEYKSEYFDGQMYAMSGGTLEHATIAHDLGTSLSNGLRGTDCRVISGDLRLRISASKYTYPDLIVYCGEPKLADDERDTLLNPVVIVEVLSKSTEAHDRGFKFAQYRRLESLREYVLVSQQEPLVEIFRRQNDGEFKLSESSGLDQVCRFESIDCTVPMAEIYRGIAFPA